MRPALLVPVALLLVATACSSSSGKKTAVTAPTDGATTGSSGPLIQIHSFAYNDLTVAPGTTITVKNLDDAEHTVTSDTKGQFVSDDVKQGTPVTFKAPTAPGKYTFHCAYHASLHGTLTVS